MTFSAIDIRPGKYFRDSGTLCLKVTPCLINHFYGLVDIANFDIVKTGTKKELADWLSTYNFSVLILKDKTLKVGDTFKNWNRTLFLDAHDGKLFLIDRIESRIVFSSVLPNAIKAYLLKHGFL